MASALEDGEDSYFISMTDLMIGMLFVFIIMLMSFALKLGETTETLAKTTIEITHTANARKEMLEGIADAMKMRGVTVIVDPENGVLRLPESVLFPLGEYRLTAQGYAALATLGDILKERVPCYVGAWEQNKCSTRFKGRLEAVFIEGHTDNVPISSRMANGIASNWDLSTARAISTFQALATSAPELTALINDRGQALFGVSGYADKRPVRLEETREARDANRRIDVRFLMANPRPVEELGAPR